MGIRILLADDHTIVLQGLSRFLREQADLEVVGQAKDGLATVTLARELSPDIIIMDISMPGLSGIEATRQIHGEQPDIKIIVLSMYPERQYALRAFRSGAAGYLTKASASSELVSAVKKILAGGKYVSATLADVALQVVS